MSAPIRLDSAQCRRRRANTAEIRVHILARHISLAFAQMRGWPSVRGDIQTRRDAVKVSAALDRGTKQISIRSDRRTVPRGPTKKKPRINASPLNLLFLIAGAPEIAGPLVRG